MSLIPSSLLNKLYNRRSLRNVPNSVSFSVKNRLAPASLEELVGLKLDGQEIGKEQIRISVDGGPKRPVTEIRPDTPLDFPLGTLIQFVMDIPPLEDEQHKIQLTFNASPFGKMKLKIKDAPRSSTYDPDTIPRDAEDDYSEEVIKARQEFVEKHTGKKLDHVTRHSFDPSVTRGNIEHFTGVAQIPLGFAGPLKVNGDHAQGEFYVPLATTEGTLVASYNRGMKVLNLSGGVTCSVVGDNMQRAPAFVFENARQARLFADWIVANNDEIKAVCDASDPFVSLKYIDYYLASKFVYLRFNYITGDAAGMNMVGKATFAACNWILQNCDAVEIERFFLEANFATDKKHSMINMMRTRGKRVTAEAVIKRDALLQIMDADTEALYYHSKVANVGSTLSGANNNGCHSANAITAIFIATGQDVANVSESSAGILYSELTPENDLYMSITLPSLIVATCGGGTGLPTQRESLETMGCYGVGNVMKFAEIVAGTVLAGEISLAAAISSLDWVSSHDEFGRNNPLESS